MISFYDCIFDENERELCNRTNKKRKIIFSELKLKLDYN